MSNKLREIKRTVEKNAKVEQKGEMALTDLLTDELYKMYYNELQLAASHQQQVQVHQQNLTVLDAEIQRRK